MSDPWKRWSRSSLAVVIVGLDNERLRSVVSSRWFLATLDQILAETPDLPGGDELIEPLLLLREILGKYVGKSGDIESLARRVNEIFGESGS